MVKLRDAGYCNLKLFLLYLVVYGHWIEAGIYESQTLYIQYRLIYLVHMPLFVFLSGLFLRNAKDCGRQIRRMLPMYVVLLAAVTLSGGNPAGFWTPYWHLWYLLSYCMWAGVGWLWFRYCETSLGKTCFGKSAETVTKTTANWLILGLSILAALGAGYIPWIDRTWSLSRAIVFFPYFWVGLMLDAKIQWHRYRRWGVAALVVALAGIVMWGDQISVTFLYQAAPYGRVANGAILRLLCYGLGALMSFFLLTAIPTRRLACTRAGADTMPGYLIHAPLVGVLREIPILWQVPVPWVMCAMGSALLLYVIYKLLQWNSPLYGIVPGERRDRRWLRFKKSTANTARRCIDSFCP